jgi:large subunit ribosomal protein L29
MKVSDVHAMSMTDLRKQLKDSRQELFNLRFQMATGQLENHRQIRRVRQTLAQVLTEIHLKELNEPAGGPAEAEPEPPKPSPAAKPGSRRGGLTGAKEKGR